MFIDSFRCSLCGELRWFFFLCSESWPGRPMASLSTTVACCRRTACPHCAVPSALGECLLRSRWRRSNSKTSRGGSSGAEAGLFLFLAGD